MYKKQQNLNPWLTIVQVRMNQWKCCMQANRAPTIFSANHFVFSPDNNKKKYNKKSYKILQTKKGNTDIILIQLVH